MDDAAVAALVDDATKRIGLVWVRSALPGHREQPMWHLWQDGSVYLLTGGIEQPPPPDLASAGAESAAFVTVSSKDTGARLVTFEADVAVVDPDSEEWDAIEPALVAKRLNLPDGEAAPQRWRRECTVFRLTPTGRTAETPDEPSRSSHATPPPPTVATTRVPRPLHLRGRPSRNRGGR